MSGRGKGGKGLGVYRPKIDRKEARKLFLKVLPKKYHDVFSNEWIDDAVIEKWLYTIMEGEDWEKRNIRERVATQIRMPKDTMIRFVGVKTIKPTYNRLKKDHQVKTITRSRKRIALKQLVQLPHVKFGIGSPEYVKAMQSFQQSLHKIEK